jgi:hypothetical protein
LNSRFGVLLDAYNDGWINQNYIHVDRITIWDTYWGQSNWQWSFGIYMETHTEQCPNLNTFSGSIEGVKYGMRLVGQYNRIESLRMELGSGCYKYYVTNSYYYLNYNSSEDYMTQWNYIFGEYSFIAADGYLQNSIIDVSSNEVIQKRALIGFGINNTMYIGPSVYSYYGDPSLYVEGTVQAVDFINISDKRLKSNINSITNPIETLKKLNGVSFYFKQDTTNKLRRFPNYKHYGFIAQDLEKVIPDLVHKNRGDSAYLNASYGGIIPFLVEGFKVQQTEIDKLNTALDSLRSKNLELDSLVKYSNASKGFITGSLKSLSINATENSILYDCIPNPASTLVKIRYYLPHNISKAFILITDIKNVLSNRYEIYSRGADELSISITQLPPGAYIYNLLADNILVDSKQLIVIK